jgi:hypothetical protein
MNTMSGYGAFYWTDGKRYKGFYVNDKKEGFGVYYWVDPSRIYIGYWKNGKQEGLGKYLSSKHTKWGQWIGGERSTWYKSREDAFEDNHVNTHAFSKFFDMSLKEAMDYIMT